MILHVFEPGYCHCGCGEKTNLHLVTRTKEGYVKGQPRRFVAGHSLRDLHGDKNSQWQGGTTFHDAGYRLLKQPDHPRAKSNGYVFEHLVIAQRALGKPLPVGAVVHHVNGVRHGNHNTNLVICQDQAYHSLLHRRMHALTACGNPHWLRCVYCKQYGDPSSPTFHALDSTSNRGAYHTACERDARRRRYARQQSHKVLAMMENEHGIQS